MRIIVPHYGSEIPRMHMGLGLLTWFSHGGFFWIAPENEVSIRGGTLCASCPDAKEVFFLAPQLLYFPQERPFHGRHFLAGVTVLNPSKIQITFLPMDFSEANPSRLGRTVEVSGM